MIPGSPDLWTRLEMIGVLCIALSGNAWAVSYAPPLPYTPPTFNYTGNASPSYQFQGYLKDGGELRFRSAIFREHDAASFVRLDDSVFLGRKDSAKRFTADFDSLFGLTYVDDKQGTVKYKAEVFKRDWIFENIPGKITIYSGGPQSGGLDYMRIGGGEVREFDKKTLEVELYKNDLARGYLVRQKIGYGLNAALVVSGLVEILIGLSEGGKTKKDAFGNEEADASTSPYLTIGIASLIGSWIPYLVVADNFTQSISAYDK